MSSPRRSLKTLPTTTTSVLSKSLPTSSLRPSGNTKYQFLGSIMAWYCPGTIPGSVFPDSASAPCHPSQQTDARCFFVAATSCCCYVTRDAQTVPFVPRPSWHKAPIFHPRTQWGTDLNTQSTMAPSVGSYLLCQHAHHQHHIDTSQAQFAGRIP